ncbi:MAG: adenylosuccinate lyase [Deltaproteobacteria bacterium]|jgi:adenylosuccinate lyase|nr:adenylosuccinate lyase [Deltaproteobacteria bacterium]
MIDRYQRPAIAAIWTLENQYASWLKVELAVVASQAEAGLIPKEAAEEIAAQATFNSERIAEIEAEVRHDVIAFVTNIEENVGPSARFFHFGLTSSDVLDTSLALRLLEAAKIIRGDLRDLIEAVAKRAREHRDTPIIGRSHGIHAEPTTFGLKLASFAAEFQRDLVRFDQATEDLAVGQISGPVGNYSASSLSPALEEAILKKLGLRPTPVSTQVIARDVHAWFFQALAMIATTCERLTVEIRHLARTEVAEVQEAFGRGQKGSSAMPHKRNPILSENITGLARIIRSLAQTAMDDVVLWHERDISHSSVERIIAPDATVLIDFILARLTSLISGLVVRPDRMLENINLTGGLYHSQEIMLSLCQSGLSRLEAYAAVQKRALEAADGGVDFRQLIESDPIISKRLTKAQLEAIFSGHRFSRWTMDIFKRLNLDDQLSASSITEG